MTDRPSSVRVPYVTDVECEEIATGKRYRGGQLSGISRRGVHVDGIPAFEEGSLLRLCLTLPALQMDLLAEVVGSTPSGGMGLSFGQLPPVHRVVIQELMKLEEPAVEPEKHADESLSQAPEQRSDESPSRATKTTLITPDPSERPSPARSDAASPRAGGGGEQRKRVLIVDDHDRTRRMLRGMIEGRETDFDVTEAHDGLEAVRIVQQAPPFNLIFLDVDMPHLDGLGACRRLRALGVRAPIIFLTGRGEAGDFQAGREAGADTYIKKPILLGTLRSMLSLFASGPLVPMGEPAVEPEEPAVEPEERAESLSAALEEPAVEPEAREEESLSEALEQLATEPEECEEESPSHALEQLAAEPEERVDESPSPTLEEPAPEPEERADESPSPALEEPAPEPEERADESPSPALEQLAAEAEHCADEGPSPALEQLAAEAEHCADESPSPAVEQLAAEAEHCADESPSPAVEQLVVEPEERADGSPRPALEEPAPEPEERADESPRPALEERAAEPEQRAEESPSQPTKVPLVPPDPSKSPSRVSGAETPLGSDVASPPPFGRKEQRKRVLIVDDHDRARRMLRGMIEGGGADFDVTEARDGLEAVRIVQQAPPFNLIFLDVDMPRLDGLAACRRLRALGVKVPIIFLAGRDDAGDSQAGREAGADTYIKKPIVLGTLRSMLTLFTNGSPVRR